MSLWEDILQSINDCMQTLSPKSLRWVWYCTSDLQPVQTQEFFQCSEHLNRTFTFTNLVSYRYTLEGVGQHSSTGRPNQSWFTPHKYLTWQSKEQMHNQAILFPGRCFLLPLKKNTRKAYLFYHLMIILPGNCKHPVLSLTRINLCFANIGAFLHAPPNKGCGTLILLKVVMVFVLQKW